MTRNLRSDLLASAYDRMRLQTQPWQYSRSLNPPKKFASRGLTRRTVLSFPLDFPQRQLCSQSPSFDLKNLPQEPSWRWLQWEGILLKRSPRKACLSTTSFSVRLSC